MKKNIAAKIVLALAILGWGSRAGAQFCPGCIQNSAAPQNAQFNVLDGQVRDTLTVNALVAATLSISNMTAGTFTGDGSHITLLNAAAMSSGTVPSARVAGTYSGITGVGVLNAGTWQGTPVGTQYGGTGQNWITVSTGSIPYFSNVGQMAVLPPAVAGVLMTQGAALPPVWTASPALNGANFFAIPMSALVTGTLPAGIAVTDASLNTVSAAKVVGNIAGGAAFLTVPLPVSNLAGGTLPTANAASSVTVTGVAPGTYGGPTTLAQVTVGTDGRAYTMAQYNLVVAPSQITSGALPGNVTVPAASITAGTLGNSVIASSVAATSVAAGSYGGPARTLTLTVQPDGRLSTIAQPNIALPPAQLTAGTLPGGVLLPAASVQAGALGGGVVASSLAASGVAPGTYGGPSLSAQLVIGADGRVISAEQFPITGGSSSSTVSALVDNNWQHAQTAQSSWTIKSDLGVTGLTTTAGLHVLADEAVGGSLNVASSVTAVTFIGSGASLTSIPNSALVGPLVSLITATTNFVETNPGGVGAATLDLGNTGVTPGTYGSSSLIPVITADAHGRITSASTTSLTPSVCTATGVPSLLCNKPGGTNASNAIDGVVSGGNANTITAGADDSVIAGGVSNVVNGAASASVISGGGSNNTTAPNAVIGGGGSNTAGGNAGTIGGGFQNQTGANWATVSGGKQNLGNGQSSAVGGGSQNHANALNSTVAGGSANVVNDSLGSIGGGANNTANGQYTTIPGGFSNVTNGSKATVGGGESNLAANDDATVGGGISNSATGLYSTIPGGDSNRVSGSWSIAQGRRAVNVDTGAYVSADSTNADYTSHGQDTWSTRYAGGYWLNMSAASSVTIPTGSINLQAGSVTAQSFNAVASEYKVDGVPFIAAGSNLTVSSVSASGSINTAGLYKVNGSQIASTNLADSASLIQTTTALGGDFSGFLPNGVVTQMQSGQVTATSGGVLTTQNAINILGGHPLRLHPETSGQFASMSFNDDLKTHLNYPLDLSVNTGGNALVTDFGYVDSAPGYKINGTVVFDSGHNLLGIGNITGGGDITMGTIAVNTVTAATGTFTDVFTGSASATGTMTAGSFLGSGSALTGLPCKTGAGTNSVLCQGSGNSSTGPQSTVAGGFNNTASNDQDTVGGGYTNTANGVYSTVAGGNQNQATAGYAMVPGGFRNVANGQAAFAAGFKAKADHDGSFVWADNTVTDFHSSGVNTWNVRSHGGAIWDLGAAGMSVAGSSVNASAFFGDGAHLTFNNDVAMTTVTVSGVLHNGWEQVTNPCGAGVTTCTATCSAGKQATGCGNCGVAAVLGVSVTTGGSSDADSCTCTALTATTITSSVYCARVDN